MLPKGGSSGLQDGEDGSAKLWFANQLSDYARASMAILNALLNVEDVDAGETLRTFRKETEKMSCSVCHVAISLRSLRMI